MLVAARYAAAIELLDQIMSGVPAEKALTGWARRSRFAGSKDRAAVRDIVFDCLRAWKSFQALSGNAGARGAALGHVMQNELEVDAVFSGEGHAPRPFDETDERFTPTHAFDLPDDAIGLLEAAFGSRIAAVSKQLTERAGVHLRVNTQKASVEQAQAALLADGIETSQLHVPNAVRVENHPRKVAMSTAYLNGSVELQDAASQAVVLGLPIQNGDAVLDYCAGGGGKTLAIAATWPDVQVDAWDASLARLENLSARAQRAGAHPKLLSKDPATSAKRYDIVLLDVPCSGSGAWRRNPDGKWKFTQAQLDHLTSIQRDILEQTHGLVKDKGTLCYVTCSLFREENEQQIAAFLKSHTDWTVEREKRFDPCPDGDGFYMCCLTKKQL